MTIEISNVAIQQINISYNPVEDRLLLKVGFADDTELAIWLTRRLVKSMWGLLQPDEPARPVVAAPGVDTSFGSAGSKKPDFTSQYKKRRTINRHELLLARDCRLLESASRQAVLELICSNGHAVKLALADELTLAMVGMLQLVCRDTGWDLPMGARTPALGVMQTSTALH
jgi:hypothetical protein